MFAILSNFFREKGIKYFSPLALTDCKTVRPYLLERAEICEGTAVLFAVPYLSRDGIDTERNLSAYAVPHDYHSYFEKLFGELLPLLRTAFPQHRFAGFSDHSPIDEVDAAARAGLGVVGKNHLLITPDYASFVFLGELVTDAKLDATPKPVSYCEDCGACMRVCPSDACGGCLSALTQKKGDLTDAERSAIASHGTVWGCDLCQTVCPHTKRALDAGTIFTPIPFFTEQTLSCLTLERLDAMSGEEFSHRAYAWRGRKTIRRNLILMNEKGEPKC